MPELQKAASVLTPGDLLRALRERGVQLSVENDRLRAAAPAGVIGSELQAAIRQWKSELIELLAAETRRAEASADDTGAIRLSQAQERLWLFQRLNPTSTAYNLTPVIRIEGPLDTERLQGALRSVLERHEPLRSLVGEDGTIQIGDIPESLLLTADVSHLFGDARAAAAQKLVQEASARPFDLAREIPFRAILIRLDADLHELVTTIHHIAVDGVSLGHFYADLTTYYAGGAPSPLRATYGEYARWQRSYWTPERLDARGRFWRETLGDAPRVLDLPLDHPRGATQTFTGDVVTRTLPAAVFAAVRDLAQTERASLFMVLLAAYSAALHRQSGQRDMVIGTPLHGRDRSELSDLVGMFVNQLPLRMKIAPDATFRTLVRDARESALRSMAEHEMPFGDIVETIGVARDPSRTPLFQVMLNVLPGANAPSGLNAGGLVFRLPKTQDLLALFDGQSRFDMTLYVMQRDDALHLALNYNRDLFSPEGINEFMGYIEHVLVSGAAEPDSRVHERWSESLQYPNGGIAGADSLNPEESVASRFARIAEAYSERVAVVGQDGDTTYAELHLDALRIAGAIASSTSDFTRPVGILVPHETVLASAILGALLAGRPYVPLDASYPEERIAYMLRDSGADLILTTPALRVRAIELGGDVAAVVTTDDVPAVLTARATPPPETTAYLLYTSGSTGRPKAVVQSQGNLVRQADRYARALRLTPSHRVALLASISFDACVMDLFGALLSGAAICPIDPRAIDLTRLPETLENRRLSIIHMTPTLFRTLRQTVREPRFPTIRAVDLGGEAMRPEDIAFFDECFPANAILVNSYGPSEHTFALGFEVPRHLRTSDIPIGWPIGDVEVVMLDPDTGAEDLVSGVMTLRSAYGATGYWNKPEATQSAFLPDPEHPGRTMYRTGDVVRRRSDGAYVFLHREDDQLKIRGHRVEPTEVESVLRKHPDVLAVAVHAPPGQDGSAVLTACIVGRAGLGVTLESVAEYAASRLPSYMVPTAWVILESLPLTPSGKVDRRALPAGDQSAQQASLAGEERSAEEQVLRQIWCDVLGRNDCGVHDDFFFSGGHSLTATQVVARVRDVLDVEIPLRAFFDHPTIAGTAAWIREHREGHVKLPPLLRAASLPDPMPLSFSQERMWLLKQLAPDNAAYNMAAALRLTGSLEVDRLRQAVLAVAQRQHAMRTYFPMQRGRPSQELLENGVEFVTETFAGASALADAQARALDFLEDNYDLAKGPLCRVFVGRIGEDDHVLGVGMHHIVSDMWAFSVFGREVAAAYNGAVLAEPAVRYHDYALWQRAWLGDGTLETQLAHWKERLAELQPLELATDMPRPPFFAFTGDVIERPLPPSLRAAIERLSSANRATPFMTLLSVFNALLATYTSQADIAVGVPIANRTQTATENLIGSFVNTLIHRNDLSGDPTFRELLARVRSTALDAFAHQDTPFELLVKELQPVRDPSRPPLVQVLFNVANVRTDGVELKGIEKTLLSLPRRTAQFELTLNVGLNALQSQLSFTYNTSLFNRETAAHMLEQYVRMLERVIEDPDVRLSDLCRVSEGQGDILLRAWNDTARAFPATDVPSSLRAVAQRTPDNIAVESPTGAFTYAELLDYAQRVAAALQALGVSPGDRVAIIMQRSREMLGALIGILGAGAAYVPVDPNYPAARVRYMLEDCAAAAVVTHRGLERPYEPTVPVLDLDRWRPAPPTGFVATDPQQAAYVIYTSGSTGKPKGVEIPHGAMVNFLQSMQERPGITSGDALLAVTTISFDIAVLELYLPLIAGARVVIAGEEEALDGRRLMHRMDDAGVTLMQATPATWKLLIAAGWQGKRDLRVLCGGEPLPRVLADELLDRVPELWNMYGPTETTVWSTLDRIERDAPILVGRPIANTTLYVLDDALRLRPIGVPGELYIGGAGVASGYVNRPDLTAERFIVSPFREGERLYRTGDLVRYREDGRIEHLGRLDDQVKVRGFRIELGEVEAALRSHPGVQDAVVAAGDDRLAGYVVFAEGQHATGTELRATVSAMLPPYMVPAFLVPLDALPLTPNGKVDRKRLPDPAGHAVEVAGFEVPTDPAARLVADVWAELLGVESIGINDNFFEIGGHSLLAMQAVALIEERTGHRPEPRSLFFMTLGELAATIPASAVPA